MPKSSTCRIRVLRGPTQLVLLERHFLLLPVRILPSSETVGANIFSCDQRGKRMKLRVPSCPLIRDPTQRSFRSAARQKMDTMSGIKNADIVADQLKETKR